MNALDAEAEKGNDEGLDFVDHATRFDILENKVTLVVPEGNPRRSLTSTTWPSASSPARSC